MNLARITVTALISFLCLMSCSNASMELGNKPFIGSIYNSGYVIKDQILTTSKLTAVTTRDTAVYAIAGLSLDAYILTLPLPVDVKASVISRLANPKYSIGLGRFLYHFYNQYGEQTKIKTFNQYLQKNFSQAELENLQHSLYVIEKDKPIQDQSALKDDDQEGKETTLINKNLIAGFVTIYDVLFNNNQWVFTDEIPNTYKYLTNSQVDLDLISQIQPIIINALARYSDSISNPELKSAIVNIINSAKPEYAGQINNKAQAITITLIDFVRLNVLKSYRQYALERQRTESFEYWMHQQFKHQPDKLIAFLEGQNNRRFGVQIAVDGLQQSLMQALVQPTANTFIKTVQQQANDHHKIKPKTEKVIEVEHQQQLSYLNSFNQNKNEDNRYLPFFKRIYQQFPQSISQFGISSTPTISVRNLPIVFTGADVAPKKNNPGTGIPNFHFIDRSIDRGYYFFGNDALQLDKILADNNVKTMFDRLMHLKTLSCNAQYDFNAQVGFDGLVNLAVGEAIRDFGEQRCLHELSKRASVEKELNKDRNQLISLIEDNKKLDYWTPITKFSKQQLIKEQISAIAEKAENGMPDYVLVYNPWPDHFAHFKGPFSDEIIAPTGELNRLDYWLSQLEKTYKKAGVYQQTLWGMAGDHGLTPVYYAINPEVQVLKAIEQERDITLTIEKISSDEGEGPKITNALNYPSFKNVDVVVASTAGGNFMMDLFNSSKGWEHQPIYSDLQAWFPKQLTETLTKKVNPIDMIHETTTRLAESLDYMVVRESECSVSSCDSRIIGTRSGQRIDELILRKGQYIYYGNADNNELTPTLLELHQENPYRESLTTLEQQEKQQLINLCVNRSRPDNSDTWCNEAQWRQLSRFTPRPDSVVQLSHLYDEDRAGTINLFPKEGIGFNTIVPGRHAGEHYFEKDAFIGFWGDPIINNTVRITPLTITTNGSLAPTIYQYLTGEHVRKGHNGWGFSSVIKNADTP